MADGLGNSTGGSYLERASALGLALNKHCVTLTCARNATRNAFFLPLPTAIASSGAYVCIFFLCCLRVRCIHLPSTTLYESGSARDCRRARVRGSTLLLRGHQQCLFRCPYIRRFKLTSLDSAWHMRRGRVHTGQPKDAL